MEDMYIFQKLVDMSLLKEGMSIPVLFQEQFYRKLGFTLKKGEVRKVNVLIDGETFSVQLKNYDFDQNKYPGHSDVVQIRYSPSSHIAIKLREIFSVSNNKVERQLETRADNKQIIIPEENREYLAIYSTPVAGTLMFDCITNCEYKEEVKVLKSYSEIEVEQALNATDNEAYIIAKAGVVKIRKLSKAIGDSLKIAYNFRCQICGEYIGEKYGTTLLHSHHIDYFTQSLNNDSSNIMVLCPNHHSIIHSTNPLFDIKNKIYKYPNGYSEGLKLNLHL